MDAQTALGHEKRFKNRDVREFAPGALAILCAVRATAGDVSRARLKPPIQLDLLARVGCTAGVSQPRFAGLRRRRAPSTGESGEKS